MNPRLLLPILVLMIGCGGSDQPAETSEDSTPEKAESKISSIGGEAGEAIQALLLRDPSLARFFNEAHGFAVWPNVGKGALIIGGGGGGGFVFEQGKRIGTSKMSFVSVGAQVGGQSFIEVIFFKDKRALDLFKQGNFEFSAQISAVAVDDGVAKDSDYSKGVAVFTMPKEGLMAEASVSGQKFTFKPD